LAAYIEAAVRMVVVPAASAGLVYVPPISQADQLPPGTPLIQQRPFRATHHAVSFPATIAQH
jgi:hypothetical protein